MMTRLFAGTPFDRPPVCDRCGKLESECVCPTPEPEGVPPHCKSVTIAVEKRKKGKTVTVLRGLSTVGNGSLELLTQLKSACGAGGTFKDGVLEIQGEHVDRIREILSAIGYRIRS
jgi:translation initiation factor 1